MVIQLMNNILNLLIIRYNYIIYIIYYIYILYIYIYLYQYSMIIYDGLFGSIPAASHYQTCPILGEKRLVPIR